MNHAAHGGIVNFIWAIADDVPRDIYVRGKYRDVILPMTVIRRLDALLGPGKQAVLAMQRQLDATGVVNQHAALCKAAGEAFYNVSPFTLRDLKNRARQQLKANFEAYLDGFSANVQEILDTFKFRNQIPTRSRPTSSTAASISAPGRCGTRAATSCSRRSTIIRWGPVREIDPPL